jgi:hypothetical protein
MLPTFFVAAFLRRTFFAAGLFVAAFFGFTFFASSFFAATLSFVALRAIWFEFERKKKN